MLTGELRSKIDGVWNAFWAGGVANPLEVIEQITYLLFMRGLDELHTPRRTRPTASASRSSGGSSPPARTNRKNGGVAYADMRWSRFEEPRPGDDVQVVGEHVFPFLRTMGGEGYRVRHAHAGRALHHPHAGAAREGRRSARRNPDGGPRHQGRPLRVHAVEDRDRRAERPVPHAAPHHRADGRDDRAEARRT